MEMKEIVIKARPATHLKNKTPVVRLKQDAYNLLVDFSIESGVPIGTLATEIIRQAAELVRFDRS
ncbi:MAG: hypothetical protein IKF99_00100 [Oscillospiraceae bacterium]|nr:hypothetical protein [Oscillospiraceae bacterium]